jgi:hypothetical protein
VAIGGVLLLFHSCSFLSPLDPIALLLSWVKKKLVDAHRVDAGNASTQVEDLFLFARQLDWRWRRRRLERFIEKHLVGQDLGCLWLLQRDFNFLFFCIVNFWWPHWGLHRDIKVQISPQ